MDPLDEQDGSNLQGAGQEDGSNLQGDGHDRSNLQGADLGDNEIGGGTPAVTSSTKRGPSKGPKALPDGKKRKAASKRNKANRLKLRAPNTLGGRSMVATQHVIAVENKFKSNLEVGRAGVYIRAHTKKDKTIQCPEIATLGKDKSGYMRGMGANVSSTMVKKTVLVLKKNEELRCENTTTNSKLDRLETKLQMVKDMIVASHVHVPASQTQRNPVLETPTAEVPLRQPSQVASGEIVAVNPQSIVHGRPMGEGVFKILSTEVVDSEARVFFPNDFASTLGEVEWKWVSAKDDKSWIDLSFPDQHFIDGVSSFVKFVQVHFPDTETTQCPCNMCKNQRIPVPYEEVKIDLLKHGFNPAYKIWYLHGESETFELTDNESRFHDHQEDVYMDDFDELLINSMAQDSGGNPDACVQDKPNTGTQGENRFREVPPTELGNMPEYLNPLSNGKKSGHYKVPSEEEFLPWLQQQAPVIIFVEDFDLFAGVRGEYIHTKKQDHETFINQLLVELDGFEKQDGVVLMATTKNLKQINQALQRPGRMDRVFHLQKPTQREREKILQISAKETMDEELIDFVDWGKCSMLPSWMKFTHRKM
ncbi:hypothetical protein IFM89_031959 [Coptis chinensis]|uniref:ATPase AAA-type core domain-containing protein n=1 Tax=Coptis chinensis TaxID=261450 RepID=A0A835H130_9MAGN|nr:hypothetical protein IFM89_031959 [Coptis chinensis]